VRGNLLLVMIWIIT